MVVATKNVTETLAAYALTLQYGDIPPPVIERAKHLLLDFLGVAFGGRQVADSTGPVIDGVRDLVGDARGSATVAGEARLYPPHYAALLNGTMAHSMDFDDTHRDAILHIGTPVFATLLALAEDAGSTGKEFLAASVAAYDIAAKIGKAHGPAMHHRGFHPSATTAIFACTAAGARVLGLSERQAVNAMGLNNSQIAGTQQFLVNGAWNKRLQVGLAAHNAVLSLFLARRGLIGAVEPIEGKYGYFPLYSGQPLDASKAAEGLGSEFEVMNTAVKPYPCCRYAHAVIDAVRDLVLELDLKPGAVESIDVDLGDTGYQIIADPQEAKRQPSNLVEAQFSVHFAAAAAAAAPYTWDSYQHVHSPEVRGLMQRVNARHDPALGGMSARTAITARDGRRASRDVLYPKGEPENPMSWEEMEAKFSRWTAAVVGEQKAARLAKQVSELQHLGSIRELTEPLRP